jgi:hypothetical protein
MIHSRKYKTWNNIFYRDFGTAKITVHRIDNFHNIFNLHSPMILPYINIINPHSELSQRYGHIHPPIPLVSKIEKKYFTVSG